MTRSSSSTLVVVPLLLLLGTLSLWTPVVLGGTDKCYDVRFEFKVGKIKDWICLGGPVITLEVFEHELKDCDTDLCSFRIGPNRTDLEYPHAGHHKCWNDTMPGPKASSTTPECAITEDAEGGLDCSYKPWTNPQEAKLTLETLKMFYKKWSNGKDYDDDVCPKPKGHCYEVSFFKRQHGEIKDWICAGGLMLPSVVKGGQISGCDTDLCSFRIKKQKDDDYVMRNGCWKDEMTVPKASSTTPECAVTKDDGLDCSFKQLASPKEDLGNLPLETLKMFYNKWSGGKDYDEEGVCPVSCIQATGYWRNVGRWECRGRLLKSNRISGSSVQKPKLCVDADHTLGLCFFKIQARSEGPKDEELIYTHGCLSRLDLKDHKIPKDPKSSSTPSCVLGQDSKGPALFCSIKPGNDLEGAAAVSKEDLRTFKTAMYKAKGWSKDKGEDVNECPRSGGVGVHPTTRVIVMLVLGWMAAGVCCPFDF